MLNNISSEDFLTNQGIAQQSKTSEINKNAAAASFNQKQAEFDDVLDISSEAKRLLEKEQEIEKYKNLVLSSLQENEKVSSILDLIGKGEYISNDELAEAMLLNDEFLSSSDLLEMLFAPPAAS